MAEGHGNGRSGNGPPRRIVAGLGFEDARRAQLARWAALTPLERLRLLEGLWETARWLQRAGRRVRGGRKAAASLAGGARRARGPRGSLARAPRGSGRRPP